MAFKLLGNRLIERVQFGYAEGISDGVLRYVVNQLEDSTINILPTSFTLSYG